MAKSLLKGKKPRPSDEGAVVPAEVLQAINRARPLCWWYARRDCKKGAKCPYLHARGAENEAHLPHASIDQPEMDLRD